MQWQQKCATLALQVNPKPLSLNPETQALTNPEPGARALLGRESTDEAENASVLILLRVALGSFEGSLKGFP